MLNGWRALRAATAGCLVILLGCAEGQGELDPSSVSGVVGVEEPDNAGIDDEPTVAGAGAFDGPQACRAGERATCTCEDGQTQGRRSCLRDTSSPRYGFLSECSLCPAPPLTMSVSVAPDADKRAGPAPDPNEGPADAGMLGIIGSPDAGPMDAGPSNREPQDTRVKEVPMVDICQDGRRNGEETDTDCGGSCDPCQVGQDCDDDDDCEGAAACSGGTCTLVTNPTFKNYEHNRYSYNNAVDWSCPGTTRFDSSDSGSWTSSSDCSDSQDERPEVSCDEPQTSVGVRVCILRARGLTIGAEHTLELVGSRPVILAVEGDVTIAGIVSADGDGTTPGAGGNRSCTISQGRDGTRDPANDAGASGGGGGGFGTEGGGAGASHVPGPGDDWAPETGGTGGRPRGNATLSPLRGGCPGGRGGGCDADGGAGGGAVQIAATGALVVTGTVRADGAPGATPCEANGAGGGTGGGSGGGVLLEGDSVDVGSATMTANGGDGGRNGSASICGGRDGAPGSTDLNDPGASSEDCQGGSPGGGGGYGRVSPGP